MQPKQRAKANTIAFKKSDKILDEVQERIEEDKEITKFAKNLKSGLEI